MRKKGDLGTVDAISFPESASFPLTSGQKTTDSGSNHFEIRKEITEFCPFSFTAVASMRMPEMVAPRVSRFLTAGQGKRRLWERDCRRLGNQT